MCGIGPRISWGKTSREGWGGVGGYERLAAEAVGVEAADVSACSLHERLKRRRRFLRGDRRTPLSHLHSPHHLHLSLSLHPLILTTPLVTPSP